MSFEWLERPCAAVGPVRLESQGMPVSYARVQTGPWVRLHDTATVDTERDSLGYAFSYDVMVRGGNVAIPVLMPTTVLSPRRSSPIAALTVELPTGDRVVLPRMERRRGDGTWHAQMAALPSAVRVRRASPNGDCDQSLSGDKGRFVLIFWALIATLALWVPLYLWWANREPPAA